MNERIIVFAGPSGVGKDTVATHLMQLGDGMFFFVTSTTTRKPRGSEQSNGRYEFVEDAEFERIQSRDALLWSECVRGKWYGTKKASVDALLGDRSRVGIMILTPPCVVQLKWYVQNHNMAVSPNAVRSFYLSGKKEVIAERLRGDRGAALQEVAEAYRQKSEWDGYVARNASFFDGIFYVSKAESSREIAECIWREMQKLKQRQAPGLSF